MGFSAAQRSRLYGEIAKLLRAGFSIDDAARAILERRLPPAARRYLEGLRGGLKRRLSIGESVSEIAVDLAPLEVSIVAAGERGGRLEDSFEHLASYFGMLDQTRRRIRASLLYPAILLHVAVVLPPIPKAVLAGDPAVATRSIAYSLIGLYLASAVALVAGSVASRVARQNAGVDRLLGAIPLFGKARRSLALARFCKVFHIHLLAAMPISPALRAAGEASQSGRLRSASAAAAGRVEAGSSLSEAVAGESAFPVEFANSLSTAELSGTLDTDLERWSAAWRESATGALDALGVWFPKILYALVVIYACWQILSMGLAYIGALEGYLDP